MAALGAAAALALVSVDTLRERVQVSALPLRATAEQAWKAAAQALPGTAAPSAEVEPAPAAPAPQLSALPENAAPSGEAALAEPAEPIALAEPAEPIALAQLEDEAANEGALKTDRVEPDDSDEPENPDEADESRQLPGTRAALRTQPVPSALPSVSAPVLAARPSLDIQRAVAAVLAAEGHGKLANKAAAKPSAVAKSAKPASNKSNSSVAAVETKPAKAAKLDPELEHALSDAEGLLANHRELDALEAFRQLGRSYPHEPRVLEGWSQIAATTKWWGESLKVAERWASVDASAPAQLHLARTQKHLGQVERAIATLKTLLAKHPSDREATSLLQTYGGTPVALR